MANEIKLQVPDIGGATDVTVIELPVKPGDRIAKDDPIATLESDKASMEIPATSAGIVKSIAIKVGDKVAKDSVILILEAEEQAGAEINKSEIKSEEKVTPVAQEQQTQTQETAIKVPDIGGASDVSVIEVLVKPHDVIEKDTALITLESEKASMEIPSPAAGKVIAVALKVGDKVSAGSLILTLETQGEKTKPPATISAQAASQAAPSQESVKKTAAEPSIVIDAKAGEIYAGPSVRRIAREFGIDLRKVKGNGRKARILKEDLQAYVKNQLAQSNTGAGIAVAPAPKIDFSQFGEIETKPLSKIKRLTGVHVHRSWVTIPHVTQFDEADITDLEAFREQHKAKAEKEGYKLTPLAFIAKACCKALQKFPQFNSSLDESGENLIYKKYYNIGIAIDTPGGLVVGVLRNIDNKNVSTIAKDMAELSKKAREKGLTPQDMAGSCFTISSLGGIGGTGFTPIVNAPDVAILGVSKAKLQPVYRHDKLVPRLILPLSLSYDHRVIDGAEAASFTNYLAQCLADLRTILL